MIGSIFVWSIRHNDNGALNMSCISYYLQDILEPMGGTFVYLEIYCDAIYHLSETIINRYDNPNGIKQIINFKMAFQIIFIEHMFSDVKKFFQIFQANRQHRVTEGEYDYLMHFIFTMFILLNCKTCLSGPRSGYFDLNPPTIEEYLPLNVEFPEAPYVVVPDEYLYPTQPWY